MSRRTWTCAIGALLIVMAAVWIGCQGESRVTPTPTPSGSPTASLANPTPVSSATPVVGGTPTPSAAHIAYVGQDGGVWITTPDGSARYPIAGLDGTEDWSTGDIRWSPNGQFIAFTRELEGTWKLYVSKADGTNVHQLVTETGYLPDFAWSPDSGRIAFTSALTGKTEVHVISVDGTGLAKLLNDPVLSEDQTDEPDWAPSGILIHASEPSAWHADPDKNWVYRVDESGIATEVVRGAAHDPRWSPDGTRIAFIQSGGSHPNWLCTMQVDGTDRECLEGWFENDQIAGWLPGSTGIVFTYDYGEGGESGPFMGLYDVVAGQRRQLGEAGDRCPSPSPTGLEVAFVRSDSIWVMDAATGAAQSVVDGTCPVSWGPGGGWLSTTPEPTRTPERTGTPAATPTLTPGPTETASQLSLAFVRDGDIWMINADGSDERRLTDWGDLERSSGAVRWAPTGDLIAALRSSFPPTVEPEYRVTVIDLEGHTVLEVPDAVAATWLPSGLLAYATPSGWNDEWTVVDLQGKEVLKLSDAWSPSWSPDESKIAYGRIVDEVGLYPAAVPVVLDVATGDVWEVDPLSKSAARIGPPTFSPDGRWLSYEYDLFDVATREKRRLPGLEVSWSPDSRYLTLLLGEDYDRLAIYDVGNEEVVWQDDFVFPATDASPALTVQGTWSPDGTRFLDLQFAEDLRDNVTRVVDVAAGGVDTVPDVGWPIDISPGGRYIASSTGWYWPLGGELWVMAMDGTGRARLTEGVDPKWRPVSAP